MYGVTVADFDFNIMLESSENILRQYEDTDTRLFYLNGNRFPIMNSRIKDRARDAGKLSSKPFYPIYTAKLIKILFLFQASSYNEYNELLFYNPNRVDSKSLYPDVLKNKTSIDSVIYEFYPMLSKEEINKLINDFNDIMDVLIKIIKLDPIAVYDMNIEHNNFIILKYPDVRAIRFSELLGENIYEPFSTS